MLPGNNQKTIGPQKSCCMLLGNAFTNDARVQKEANTLVSAGWQGTILAVHKPGETARREKHPNGLLVLRLNSRLPRLIKRLLKRGKGINPSAETAANASAAPPRGFARLSLFLVNRIIDMRFIYKAIKLRADVYHAHDYDMLLNGWIAAKLTGAALVYDAHEISTDREGVGPLKAKYIALIEKRITPEAQAVICTTGMRAEVFKERYRIPMPTVLQNKCNFFKMPKSNVIRERLGLPDEIPIVLYQGGLQRGRGLRNLIKIAARLKGICLVFMGAGAQEAELMALVRQQGLRQKVFFIPKVTLQELPVYTASADIGIHLIRNTCLNHYTTDSNKLFEYLMSGLPAVMSDFPEIRKVLEGYGVGVAVNPTDLDLAVRTVQNLIDDKEQYGAMLKNIERHRQAFAWESEEGKLVNIYKEI